MVLVVRQSGGSPQEVVEVVVAAGAEEEVPVAVDLVDLVEVVLVEEELEGAGRLVW